MSIRLVMADDHPLILKGLADLFRLEQDFEVIACCSNGSDALSAIREHQPDIAVIDIRMPLMGGLEVARYVRKEKLTTKLVLLTAELEEEVMVEVAKLEVHGIVLKEMAPQLLVQCIRKVHSGGQWTERLITARTLEIMLRREAGAREVSSLLTVREIDLVREVVNGLSNRKIADKLCISEGTVKVHLHNIYDKLQIKGRMALLSYAQEKDLI